MTFRAMCECSGEPHDLGKPDGCRYSDPSLKAMRKAIIEDCAATVSRSNEKWWANTRLADRGLPREQLESLPDYIASQIRALIHSG